MREFRTESTHGWCRYLRNGGSVGWGNAKSVNPADSVIIIVIHFSLMLFMTYIILKKNDRSVTVSVKISKIPGVKADDVAAIKSR